MTSRIDPTKEAFAASRSYNRTGPIHMLNLVRFREKADYQDERGVTAAEAYATSRRDNYQIFSRLGGHIAWRGDFELMLIGPSQENWDECFIAEYPSVEAFVQMLRDPDYHEAVKHRHAAVLDSRLIRLAPIDPGSSFSSAI